MAQKFTEDGILESASPERKREIRLGRQMQAEETRLKNEDMAGKLQNLKDGVTSPAPFRLQGKGGSKTIALDRLYGKSEPGGIHQILGVSAPSSGVDTNLFTVLASHTARVSVLWVANRRLIDAKIRIGFDIAGAGTNVVPDAAWLYFNVPVPSNSTLVLDAATGLWLGTADDVVVRTDVGGVNFGASGVLYATV